MLKFCEKERTPQLYARSILGLVSAVTHLADISKPSCLSTCFPISDSCTDSPFLSGENDHFHLLVVDSSGAFFV